MNNYVNYKNEFYHSSDLEFSIGDKLLPKRLDELEQRPLWLRMLEEIFENVRIAEFKDRPSRLNSVYLAPTLKDTTGRKNNYLVKCNGKVFFTDQEVFSAAGSYAKSKEEQVNYARLYWRNKPENRIERPEVLVEGKIEILKKL